MMKNLRTPVVYCSVIQLNKQYTNIKKLDSVFPWLVGGVALHGLRCSALPGKLTHHLKHMLLVLRVGVFESAHSPVEGINIKASLQDILVTQIGVVEPHRGQVTLWRSLIIEGDARKSLTEAPCRGATRIMLDRIFPHYTAT